MPFLPVSFTLQRRVRLAQSLWLLFWASALAGAALLGLGVFFKVELRKRSEIMDNQESHLVPNLLLLLGALCCGLSAFGGKLCHDALEPLRFCSSKARLRPFLLGCCGLSLLLLLLLLLCLLMQVSVYLSLAQGLSHALRFYKDTDTPGRCFMKRTLDLTQISFQCCGDRDYRDWFQVQWVSNRYLDMGSEGIKDRVLSNVDGKFLMDSVPFSCCNPASPRPCIQHHLTNNSAHYDYDHRSEELNIWRRGCRDAVFSYYSSIMNGIAALLLLTALLQVVGVAGLRYLSTSLESMADPENPECESEGWLLEKGVKETLGELLANIKALGRANQVEEEAGPAPEATA